MTAAWRGGAGLLLALLCLCGHAAEPLRQLAFLRAYPQAAAPQPAPPASPSPSAAPDAAPQAPQPAPEQQHAAQRALGGNDFYDPQNPDLAHLQRHDAAMADLPKDANGFPDWMQALKRGLIQPRAAVRPGAAMDVLDLDVIMKGTKEMPYVRFPHRAHTQWLDCSNCHPQPFEPRAGATKIGMADIFRGKYCGMCHDRVAFITFFSCQRCHSVPQPGSAAR